MRYVYAILLVPDVVGMLNNVALIVIEQLTLNSCLAHWREPFGCGFQFHRWFETGEVAQLAV
jgi:hypothetical protein